MKIKIYSRGETDIDADGEYQEPAIREAIEDGCNDVPSAIIDCTGTERSDISHDEYAVIAEDDGTELWRGWLSGDQAGPAPDSGPVTAATPGQASGQVARLIIGALGVLDFGQPQDAQPAPGLRALADELDRLAGEHMAKADEYDRDAAQENFHRGCSAALGNAAGRIRHLIAGQEPQPAPGLAAAMAEARHYREALERVRAIILEGDNSTEGSRLRRSRAVIRAALEGR